MKKFFAMLAFVSFSLVASANTNSVKCMAENIYFETLGASHDAKRAVAQVTMNRVIHSKFPNSVCGVVYQRTAKFCQYSWACNKNRKIKNQTEYNISLAIAREAVSGKIVHEHIYRSKALFFHARKSPQKWKYRRVYADKYHVFYAHKL